MILIRRSTERFFRFLQVIVREFRIASAHVRLTEIVQRAGHVGMVGGQSDLLDLQRLLVALNGLIESTVGEVDVPERGGDHRVMRMRSGKSVVEDLLRLQRVVQRQIVLNETNIVERRTSVLFV